MSDKSDYEVGYGKPPKHTQFKPGQSGNPKGRKRNARGLKTDLREELFGTMKIRMNGEDISGTKQQLMLRTLSTRAASGDVRATRILLDLVLQLFGPDDHTTGPKKLSPLDQQVLDQLLSRARLKDPPLGQDPRSSTGGDTDPTPDQRELDTITPSLEALTKEDGIR